IGVMIDDLVTRGVSEPYRMFTSRAEFRLRLRADNADQRLTPLGLALGCIGAARERSFSAKATALAEGRARLDSLTLSPTEGARQGLAINKDGRRRSAFELLSYPDVDLERLSAIWPEVAMLDNGIAGQLVIDARYAAYVKRQDEDVDRLRRDQTVAIPDDIDYAAIAGLSNEVRQKFARHRPMTLAQALRIDGVTPAAAMLLLAHLKAQTTKAGRTADVRKPGADWVGSAERTGGLGG
ncbi:MAG: tRNA uridine-5-carboxymethylaminomethyl(34) synthesis enzyme MnmG, partial [Hyphomicrobiaceae bacterium]|nr:tRNA uridine-5-carboxymethylaminomethyl(34) synthesis enzyme MnmG [Hyphomicrobiaceae bacterium]